MFASIPATAQRNARIPEVGELTHTPCLGEFAVSRTAAISVARDPFRLSNAGSYNDIVRPQHLRPPQAPTNGLS